MKLMPEREDKTVIGEKYVLLLLFPTTPFMLQYETNHAQVSGRRVRYSSRLPVIETRIADFES